MNDALPIDSVGGSGSVSDADRLADATLVRHGPEGSGALRQVLYVLYVVALFGAFWGVALTRGALLEVDLGPALTTLKWPATVFALLVTLCAVVAVARHLGTVRGPAVPPLPWIDLVASTSIDRALVLRESWRVALFLIVGSSFIVGLILGLSGAITGAWSPAWSIACAVGSTAMGWLGSRAYLAGQASTGGAASGWTTGRWATSGWSVTCLPALRSIRCDRLREQAARSALLHGSVLVGDLRVAQLSLGPARASARFVRLRATGPLRTIVGRDLLGYRRAASRLVSAGAFTLVGVVGICWALDHPGTSFAVPLVAAAAVHVGCGTLCGGLRLQSDTAGAPTLIGVAPRRQLLAHLVAPSLGSLVVALPVALGTALAIAHSPGEMMVSASLACLWTLMVVVLSLAGHAWGAFRGSVPFDLVTSGAGPVITALWYAVPTLVVSVGAGVLTSEFAGNPSWWPFAVTAIAASWILWLAVAGLDEKTDAHRL